MPPSWKIYKTLIDPSNEPFGDIAMRQIDGECVTGFSHAAPRLANTIIGGINVPCIAYTAMIDGDPYLINGMYR